MTEENFPSLEQAQLLEKYRIYSYQELHEALNFYKKGPQSNKQLQDTIREIQKVLIYRLFEKI